MKNRFAFAALSFLALLCAPHAGASAAPYPCIAEVRGWAKMEALLLQLNSAQRLLLQGCVVPRIASADDESTFAPHVFGLVNKSLQLQRIKEAAERVSKRSLLVNALLRLQQAGKLSEKQRELFANVGFNGLLVKSYCNNTGENPAEVWEEFRAIVQAVMAQDPAQFSIVNAEAFHTQLFVELNSLPCPLRTALNRKTYRTPLEGYAAYLAAPNPFENPN